MFGGTHNLAAGTVAAVGAATTAMPPVQNDIRMAFTGGAVVSPIFTDHLLSLVRSLEMFNAAPLNVGGGAQTEASIRADPDLEALRVTLEMLANGREQIGSSRPAIWPGCALLASNFCARPLRSRYSRRDGCSFLPGMASPGGKSRSQQAAIMRRSCSNSPLTGSQMDGVSRCGSAAVKTASPWSAREPRKDGVLIKTFHKFVVVGKAFSSPT